MRTSVVLTGEDAQRLEDIRDELMVDASNAEIVRQALKKFQEELE